MRELHKLARWERGPSEYPVTYRGSWIGKGLLISHKTSNTYLTESNTDINEVYRVGTEYKDERETRSLWTV
jgi:hypothetical protein